MTQVTPCSRGLSRSSSKRPVRLNDNLWHQHALIGIAPAGTVNVRVRASMVNGEFNADLAPGPGQSAFIDDFELTTGPEAPEPATWMLCLLGLALAGVRRFRSTT